MTSLRHVQHEHICRELEQSRSRGAPAPGVPSIPEFPMTKGFAVRIADNRSLAVRFIRAPLGARQCQAWPGGELVLWQIQVSCGRNEGERHGEVLRTCLRPGGLESPSPLNAHGRCHRTLTTVARPSGTIPRTAALGCRDSSFKWGRLHLTKRPAVYIGRWPRRRTAMSWSEVRYRTTMEPPTRPRVLLAGLLRPRWIVRCNLISARAIYIQ
jgi:hypothetical protein